MTVRGHVDHLLNQKPARTAATAGPAGRGYVLDIFGQTDRDEGFDSFLRNAETGADHRLFAAKLFESVRAIIVKRAFYRFECRIYAGSTIFGNIAYFADDRILKLLSIHPVQVGKVSAA